MKLLSSVLLLLLSVVPQAAGNAAVGDWLATYIFEDETVCDADDVKSCMITLVNSKKMLGLTRRLEEEEENKVDHEEDGFLADVVTPGHDGSTRGLQPVCFCQNCVASCSGCCPCGNCRRRLNQEEDAGAAQGLRGHKVASSTGDHDGRNLQGPVWDLKEDPKIISQCEKRGGPDCRISSYALFAAL